MLAGQDVAQNNLCSHCFFSVLPLPLNHSVLCFIEAVSCFPPRGETETESPRVIKNAITIEAAEANETIGKLKTKEKGDGNIFFYVVLFIF